MLYFTIALRSEKSTDRWDSVVSDFENTLCSLFNQTSSDFQVYVGCNEIPDLQNAFDQRLHFVQVNTPLPTCHKDGCRDRGWKQVACCAAIKHDIKQEKRLSTLEDGVFVFPVDADDFVNCKLAEYVAKHPDANGFKSVKSYKWYKGSSRMELTPYFGGTMNIMKLRPDELPDEMPDVSLFFDQQTCAMLNEKCPVWWDDCAVEGKMKEQGRPFDRLPFCSTIYVLNTGANLSSNDPNRKKETDDRIHWGVLLKKLNPFIWKRMDDRIRTEFGIRNSN